MASVDGLVKEEFAAAGRNDALTDAVGIRVCRNHPEFIERLAAAESPAAVAGIVEELRAVVREAVDRHIEIEDLRTGVAERARLRRRPVRPAAGGGGRRQRPLRPPLPQGERYSYQRLDNLFPVW